MHSKKLAVLPVFLILLVGSSAHAQATDLLFLIDETGTMTDEIATLKASVSTVIVPSAVTALGDVAFGVARYRDFPVSPYGDPVDSPYQLLQALTTNSISFQIAMNALNAGGGNDIPESNLHALHSVATGSPGWRPGAARVILWVGDAPGHDGDLEPGYASCCSTVGLADAISALGGADIAVHAFSAVGFGLDDTGKATAVTSSTGGTLASDLTPGGIVSEIVAVIEGPLADPNNAPVANAGPDQEVLVDEPLTLTGSAFDPDDDPIVSWQWT